MRTRLRGGLFGKYVGTFVGFAVFVLMVNGALEIGFTYRETTAAVIKVESEKAEAAALRIAQQIAEIERQIAWTTRASAGLEQRRNDYMLLLQQMPAIDELMQLDGNGKELLRVSRFTVEAVAGTDYSKDPRFVQALARQVWIGPVTFRNEVDPYISIAMAHSGQYAGVTVAEVDLRFLQELVAPFAVGDQGYAYVIGAKGRLLAASGQLKVPRGSDLGGLPQVASVVLDLDGRPAGDRTAAAAFGRDLGDRSVLAAAVAIPRTDWLVLVEQPLSEAFKPFYVLLLRIAGLILLCILLAVLAGVLLARRMVVPIRALAAGAARLGAGDFSQRIEVRTGDELEALADEFNRMAAQLDQSYTRLEQTVEERTRDLARSVRELKALEEIGRTVASSLDLKSVLSTIVDRAVDLARADGGAIFAYDKAARAFRLAEAHGLDAALVEEVGRMAIPLDASLMGRAALTRQPIGMADLGDAATHRVGELALAAGFRSALVVPLVGPEEILGSLVVQRRDAGEFPPGIVGLMRTFADQSVIAMHNAELFRELAERGRQLQIANEHKSQFFANMSHELRTPLNAVLGYAELLVDGLYGELPAKAVDVLERVQANGRHLLGLINDVLDLSKIEAGQLALAADTYAMRGVVEQVVAATESLARAKGLALTTEIAEDLPLGHGDERRLTQVFLNIVGNAIKFTEHGAVAIRVGAADGQFLVAVRDTGPGIAPEDRQRIFDEFQQVDNSNTRQKGGTGLGLAIARRLVEMHGGAITLESEVGVGSEFLVRLPVRPDLAPPAAAETPAAAPAETAAGATP
ncbi:ATP-binding protein [Rhodoplanes sp. TEM]|uniref:histidine kinase n=1 Tax=Rhodoplanes tepidamans TaxID=200616 RepID=A0ABT5J610_RHOTP|nr:MULTISPECIES: ATP-binding protein [Rhodoplanes]MDC7784475.1 ATP-binding protein [Rhodoplanes tepidamans]MDC7983505.1 ATP-binding protein [Rhodoplanes sp. TEM]MDQ0356983.1 signal transduction histidine kinase [Rhodoplanes tepidamans]